MRAVCARAVLYSGGMADDLSRILSAEPEDEADLVVEGTLRPRTLDEYIGQRVVKANLSVLLTAAKGRGEAADHILLYGPPGLGKTTLATIVARELGVNVRYTSGPAIERAGDLASVLTSLDDHDVLFIDEIHRHRVAAVRAERGPHDPGVLQARHDLLEELDGEPLALGQRGEGDRAVVGVTDQVGEGAQAILRTAGEAHGGIVAPNPYRRTGTSPRPACGA